MAGPFNAFGTPFGAPSPAPPMGSFPSPFGASAGRTEDESPFGASRNSTASPSRNPFGALSAVPAFQSQPAQNPFGNQPAQNSFANPFSPASSTSQTASPFGAPSGPAAMSSAQSPFGSTAMGTPSPFGKDAAGPKTGFGGQGQRSNQPASSPFSPAARKPPPGSNGASAPSRGPPSNAPAGPKKKQKGNRAEKTATRPDRKPSSPSGPLREPTERTKEISPFAYEYANKLYEHLRKENIKPPQWPADLGNPKKRANVESLKEAYKKYRARVYESLRKADLIDDPEKKRRLADALPFKGICEELCPEFEQISRIAEHDVKREEKETQPDGLTDWPNPSKMLKKFGRSAAGQDAPLPMDVRSIDALRRTVDYMFLELLQSENNLPSMHNFLWDRTRAVRRDFTFHSQKSAEEMKDMVYCFETIARFHATSLHLLSRKGHAQDDFDAKQEIEQLGRTILSLMEAYDACREKGVECENEAEFRAYYLLLNVHDASIAKRIPTWGKEYWFDSEEVQTALSLLQAMEDVREPRGPIKPRRGITLADTAFTNYFAMVENPKVSYTMACIAEVHFTHLRQNILRNLVKGYARYRDAPRTLSAEDLNKILRFDTKEEAVEFAEAHNFEFSTEYPAGKAAPPAPYLLLNNKKKHVPSPRVAHTFSGQLVERKRGTASLQQVIYNTVYEEVSEKPKEPENSPDSMFVSQTPSTPAFPRPETPSFLQSSPTVTTFPQPVNSTSVFGTPAAKELAETPKPPLFTTSPIPNTNQNPAPQASSPFSFLGQFSQKLVSTKPAPSFVGQPTNAAQTLQPVFGFNKTAGNPTPAVPAAGPSLFSTPGPSTSPEQSAVPVKSVSFAPPLAPGHAPAAPSAIFPPLNLPKPPQQPAGEAVSGSVAGKAPALDAPSLPVTKPTPSLSLGPKTVDSTSSSILPEPVAFGIQKPSPSPASQLQPSAQAAQSILTPGIGSSVPAPPQPRSEQAPLAAIPPVPKRDLLGGLTKWYVLGDNGLMADFTDYTVQELVQKVFDQWQQEEAEKKRKAEEEQSWKEARQFRTYSLGVRYFYKWRETARTRATQRRLIEGKEKIRAYREQQRLEKKKAKEDAEKAERQVRRDIKRRIEADGQRLTTLAVEERNRRSVTEEQLFASGIFSGFRDEAGAVRRVLRDDGWEGTPSYAESELELEPRRLSVSTRDPAGSPDSTDSKKEGWKTRSLREKFGITHRRSLSSSGSVYSTSKLRRSLQATKVTNFSLKRSATGSEEERDAKRKPVSKTSGFKTRHWDLRARGFVPMPDGQWLPESLAKSTRADDSINNSLDDSFRNDLRSPAGTTNDDIQPSSIQLRLERLRRAGVAQSNGYRSPSTDIYNASPRPTVAVREEWAYGKRKRDFEEQEEDIRRDSFASKTVRASNESSHAMVKNLQSMVQECAEVMDMLEEDGRFFREQSGVYGDGS